MADASSVAPPRRKHRSRRRTERPRQRSRSLPSTSSEDFGARVLNVEKLPLVRAEGYATSSDDHHEVSSRPMAQEQQQRRRASVKEISRLDVTSEDQGSRIKRHREHHHRRRRPKHDEDDPSPVYVYNSTDRDKARRSTASLRSPRTEVKVRSSSFIPDHVRVWRNPGLGGQDRPVERRESRTRPRSGTIRRHTYPATEEIVEAPRARSVKRVDLDTVTLTSTRRPRVARNVSMREPSVRSASRPSLARSQTSTRKVRRVAAQQPVLPVVQEDTETIVTASRRVERSISVFGAIFGGSKPTVPEAQVDCLTCMSDDIPISRSAKLACGHRMCHACLRRIFTMSVSDPAHMPPTCCTSDHIPLKHVEKLFDLKFKMKWNKKYQEYTTNNRIYCPAKGCGEWIKPTHIHTDTSGPNTGRKYGRCTRCKTKVCTTCNCRWHASRECPKDEATTRFAEIAKQEGWQRCFNCSAMVELKEGCNHMTCRCQAEFCMICGIKWKSCDCPWFNYAAVEHDRLLHLNVGEVRREGLQANGMPQVHHEELERRAAQERADEVFARHMQGLNVGERAENNYPGNVFAVGNAAGHFMNEPFVQRAVANYGQTQTDAFRTLLAETSPPPLRQPTVLMRQHSSGSRRFNDRQHSRASANGMGISARELMNYGSEAARHRPPVVRAQASPRRQSAMAGLTSDTAEGRVAEWRQYVEDDGSDLLMLHE